MKKFLTVFVVSGLVTGLLGMPAEARSTRDIELAIEGAELDALPPGLEREYRIGEKFNVAHHGTEAYHEVIRIKDGFVTFLASYGCKFRKQDLFSPPVEWHNCDGRSGTQEIISREGSPWPLTVGKTFSYTVKGSDTSGNKWQTVQSCIVEGAFSISIRSGEHKTYKIVCDDDWLHQVWYWSPVLREYVKYLRDHSEEPELCDTDMIGVTPAEGTGKAPFSVENLFENRVAK